MGSEVPAPPLDASVGRSSPSKKNRAKVPKRIHKAEREKMKREHLNDLFLELADALELTQPNNGKASILNEATRLLRELLGQIDGLKEENETLLSESQYVTVEKNELREENTTLESQISKLQSELEERRACSNPDLNVAPQQTDVALEATLQQPPAVLIVPLRPELRGGYAVTDAPQLASMATVNVSKPHARYPTPADSWPSQLLGEQRRKDFTPDSNRIR